MFAISVVMFVMVLVRLVFSGTKLATWILSISVASNKFLISEIVSLWCPSFSSLAAVFVDPLT